MSRTCASIIQKNDTVRRETNYRGKPFNSFFPTPALCTTHITHFIHSMDEIHNMNNTHFIHNMHNAISPILFSLCIVAATTKRQNLSFF